MTDWFDLHFESPERALALWAIVLFAILVAVLHASGRNKLASFMSLGMASRLTARSSSVRGWFRLAFFLAAMVLGVFALMRPQARGKTETVTASQVSADVMFVLDVSRSMLAEDAPPNRLARAKAEIGQLVSRLDGQRVGLIAFAGRAVPVCPLTPDHSFFNTVLGSVTTKSAGKGGTRVGEAIKAALRGFPSGPGAKLIVLITDGDDQDPYTQEAAVAARDAGVKIVAVGLGSVEGSTITLTDPDTGAKTTLMYEGKPVISKLDGKALEQVALTTEGAYIPAATNAIDLDAIMESHVQPIVRSASDAATRVVPAERFAYFVFAGLVCLLVGLWLGADGASRRSA